MIQPGERIACSSADKCTPTGRNWQSHGGYLCIRTGDSDLRVTQSHIEHVIMVYRLEIGAQDLGRAFAGLAKCATWSSSPRKCVEEICKLESFYTRLFRLCPNGVVHQTRLIDALVNIDGWTLANDGVRSFRWNFGIESTPIAAKHLGATIRIGARKLRDLKDSTLSYEIAMHGRSSECKATIDKLIGALCLRNAEATADSSMEIFDKVLAGELSCAIPGEFDVE